MKCKKLITFALTGAMALSIAAPAFAAESNLATEISGGYDEIEIAVTVQPTGTAVINPYSMPVQAMYKPETGDASSVGELTSAGQIATQPLVMVNKSSVNLSVGAEVTATMPTASQMELVTTAPTSKITDKQALVYLEMKRDTTLRESDITTSTSKKPICGIDGSKVVEAFNAWPASTYNKSAKDQVVVNPEESTVKQDMAIMNAASKGATASSKNTANPGSFVLYRLGGVVVKNPDEAWTKKDTFTVNAAFKFTPVASQATGAVTATNTVLASNALAVAAPSTLTGGFSANATYYWEIVDEGDYDPIEFKDATVATPHLLASAGDGDENPDTELSAGGTIKVKCTVTDGNVIYVSEDTEITLTTS